MGVQVGVRRLLGSLAATVALTATAACTGGGTTVKAGDGSTSTTAVAGGGGGSALVLQIRTGGGFVAVESMFGAIPEFSLYGDGRVIVTGPTTQEFPGRALPNLLVTTVSPTAVHDAVAAARAAGVEASPDLGQPPVADAPTTRFTLADGGRTNSLDAYALGFDAGPALTAAQRDARTRLGDLRDAMSRLGLAADTPYQAGTVSVLVRPYATPEPGVLAPDPAPKEARWPLADLATGGREQFGGRCLGFSGADAATVLAAAADARSNTRWLSGTAGWALSLRPELPGVAACSDR